MTDSTTDRITELLAEHEARWMTHVDSRPYDVMYCATPDCDWSLRQKTAMTDTDCIQFHRAHVASLLAVLVADAQADAWEDAHREMHGSETVTCFCVNPYRKVSESGEGEKLQQQIDRSEGEEHAGSDKVVGTHTPHNTPTGDENE